MSGIQIEHFSKKKNLFYGKCKILQNPKKKYLDFGKVIYANILCIASFGFSEHEENLKV